VTLELATSAPAHRPETEPDDWLVLRIRDDGVGMDSETIENVFDPFFSLKERGKDTGTGLGLSVVYGIVEALGGHIAIDSEIGQGTTFSIHLPRCADEAMKQAVSRSVEIPELCAVLVEDDPSVRRALGEMMRRMGLRLHAFDGGDAVLEWIDQNDMGKQVDLIVSDIRMPGMDGYEVVAQCRSKLGPVPVIFMTGFDPEGGRRPTVENSMVLMKPVSPEDIVEALSGLHDRVDEDRNMGDVASQILVNRQVGTYGADKRV